MNYLIVSSFYRLNNKLINDIIKGDSEIIKIDYNNSSIEEIIEELKYNSIFDANKIIIVYNCNLFSASTKIEDDQLDLFVSYLKNSNPNNILIFIQNESVDNRKKMAKLMKEYGNVLDYSKIKYNDLLKYIDIYIKKNNWEISNEIINYIIKSTNNNYDLICNEIDKLKLAFPNSVSLEEAKKVISNSISDNIFKFVDQVISKDFAKSREQLNNLKIFKIDPSVILNMIFREFRFIYLYKIATSNGLNVDSIFKNEGVMDWQLNKIVDNSRRYKLEEICLAIKLLSDYDYNYKSGKIDRALVIDMFLLEFMY